MFLLFHGQNLYEIEKKLSALREKFFLTDQSGLNFSEIDGEKLIWNEFASIVFAIPFLGAKRLIIIKDFIIANKDSDLKKKIAENLEKIPESSVVIFAEKGAPDQRTVLFKALNKPKISQKFELLSTNDFSRWLASEAKESDIEIEPKALATLNMYLEGDQWRGENEISKLSIYVKSQKRGKILEADVELLVAPKQFANIFDFVEALAQRNVEKAISSLNILRDNGEAEHYIFSMIVYQFRVMLKIADLFDQKMTSSQIASKAKIHPFVVSKTLPLLKNFTTDALKRNYQKIAKVDFEMKSGKGEIESALPLLVFDFCAN